MESSNTTSIPSIPPNFEYSFNEESFDSFLKDIIPLAIENYFEMGSHTDKIPLDPNIDAYRSLYDSGKLKIYTIRDSENNLLGYNIFAIFNHMYHKTLPMALQDVTYVSPAARGFIPIKFIKWCDEQLINLKVQLILYHVKPKRDFSPLLKRLGYSLADNVYVKYILES